MSGAGVACCLRLCAVACQRDNRPGRFLDPCRRLQVINVDPKSNPGDNTTRTEIRTGEYLQCVIYDHFTRRKG
jgi:hypothetical protein